MQEPMLDAAARRFGCFISSLPDIAGQPEFISFLQACSSTDYSPEEWSYSLTYLYRRQISLASPEEVAGFLAGL